MVWSNPGPHINSVNNNRSTAWHTTTCTISQYKQFDLEISIRFFSCSNVLKCILYQILSYFAKSNFLVGLTSY